MKKPGQLRGEGPLQIAGAATTVSVEAQEWAANFYRRGGYPSMVLHSETELEDTEADELATAWAGKPPNWPRVTSGDIEAKEFGINPQGAQMLDARAHQDGEAARMFRVPGTLVEYNAPGSSPDLPEHPGSVLLLRQVVPAAAVPRTARAGAVRPAAALAPWRASTWTPSTGPT